MALCISVNFAGLLWTITSFMNWLIYWLIDKLCMLTYSTAIGNFSHYWYCSVLVCSLMFWAMCLYWSATIFMPHSWFLSSLLQQTTSKLCSQYDFCSLFCSVVILQWIEMKLGKCGFLFWHVYIPGIHSMYHFHMTDWQRLEMLLLCLQHGVHALSLCFPLCTKCCNKKVHVTNKFIVNIFPH